MDSEGERGVISMEVRCVGGGGGDSQAGRQAGDEGDGVDLRKK